MALRQTTQLTQNRGNRRTVAPTIEPITLSELKTHLRIVSDAEDLYLSSLIQEAVEEIEDATGLAILTQSWKLTLDRWPVNSEKWWDGEREGHINEIYAGGKNADVQLPRYPLITVDSVTVYDDAGTSAAVVIADTFDVDTSFIRGRLSLKSGSVWPVALRANAAIEIVYTAGHGATTVEVPSPIKRAVRQLAAYMYAHRGDGCDVKDAYTASGAGSILSRYRDVEV